MSRTPIPDALHSARVIVCAGTGGVGKTTIAAALALEAARRGRRTLVLTIDPARRLANAFGLETLGTEPVRIALAPSNGSGSAVPEPFLEVMMLSTRRAFDQLVMRLTPDESTRRRILENRIYHHLAEALAGSTEYAAMAEVQALAESGRHDLIVVDTPPAQHALDFLRAPGRLQAFLDSRFFHALVEPAMAASRFSFRLFARPIHGALSLLERIAGLGFLEDLTELLRALDGLSGDLSARAKRVEALLFGEQTKFLLVCRALAGSERTTGEFMAGIAELGAPLTALIVNRMHPWPADVSPSQLLERCRGDALAADLRRLADALAPDATSDAGVRPERDVSDAILDYARMCSLEESRFDALAAAAQARSIGVARVTERSTPLDHLDGLQGIASQLTDEAAAEANGLARATTRSDPGDRKARES